MNKRVITFFVIISTLSALIYGSNKLHNYAYKQGMRDYHGMCIGLPGARVDKEDGTVVECYGVGRLTPHELQQLQEVER